VNIILSPLKFNYKVTIVNRYDITPLNSFNLPFSIMLSKHMKDFRYTGFRFVKHYKNIFIFIKSYYIKYLYGYMKRE